MPALTSAQLRTFAEDGCIVVPDIVSHDLIDTAREAIAARVAQDPPPPHHRGPHFHFIAVPEIPTALLAPLFESQAAETVRSLMGAGAAFDPPDHVQISRNVPPWPHHPGGPHIDGLTPPEADGRPGTFTVLAGIFLTDQSREDAGNLLLAHYLPGHNIGGNVSNDVREVLYYRLRRENHRARWREVVVNPLLEFASAQSASRPDDA